MRKKPLHNFEKLARNFFHFGARSKKFSNRNKKNLAPLYAIKSNRNRSVFRLVFRRQ
nr:hypothetical protein [Porphyromonas gulae]